MTPNLNLPYLLQNQAQKHVTLNESLRFLDQLVQSSCEAMLTAPPASPVNGNCFIVLSPATDEWAGHENAIAGWYDGAWQFAAPQPGWRTFVRSDSRVRYWSGTSWDTLVSADGQVDRIGVNTSADATNKLAVSSAATLFSHEGSDHRVMVNKAAPLDSASLVFQENFSARAEIGLLGDDVLGVKVSQDGTSWRQALAITPSTGETRVTGIQSAEILLDDDTAVLVTPPSASGMMAITLYSETFPQVPVSGIVCFDAGTTPSIAILANGGKLGGYPNQALSGTTGADTQLNIGTVSGGIWIENRFGSSQSFRYFFFC